MALKRWAVRQISGLLSDYLEGITEQNLQASLSLEVGEVEIRHVRVHSELLGSLQLLSSDVSVSARIPWRNLGSEPTVITVQNVWVEVQAAKGDEQTAREELRRWRARKRRSVEAQVERARAQAEEEPRRGVAARFGHAALRQLQVRVEGLKARVHPEAASSMDLSITRLALDEGCGDDSVPAEVRRHVASLDKVLELVGLSCHLCRREADSEHWSALRRALEEKQRRLESSAGSDGLAAEVVEIKGALMQTKKACPLMGPLSLDARLWHSRAGGVLWLQTELQVAPSIAALCLSPSNMEYISNIWNWYTEHFSRPRLRHDEQVPTCSGPDYAELCVRRARGEEQEGDQQRLEEIEDLAPVEWLARWQKSVEAPEAQPRGRRWLRPWRQVPEEDDIEDIVEEAGKQSFFEEVEGPRRLELRVVIPTCRILSLEADAQSAHDLRLEGGVQGQLSLSTAREGAMRDFMKAAWDADVSAKLSSIAVLLGDEPLMLLRHSNNEQPPSPPKRQASQDDEDEFFDVESDVEDEEVWNATESAAVNLLIRCARFGGSTASGGAALPWDFRVRLKQEPFRFLLAPQTTHSALNLVLSVIRAATLTRVPAQKVLTDPHSPMAAQEEEFEAIALDLDLDVAAPVFRWDLSEGHVTVALGRLVFRSSQAPPPQQLSPPERCDWRKFACFCQLTETSITVGEKSVECRVYEPSTMSLRAWREADSWHWTLDSQAVRWVIDPLFMQVTGQLPVSFDYAISPLRDVLSDTVPISGDARSDEVPTADVTVEQVTESAKPKTHFKLAIASTEFVLCPAAGQKVSLSLDGISAQYCGYEGRHDVQGEVASCHLSCDSVVLVSFTRGASLEAKSAQDVHVKAGSTLIAVQWYERYIRLAMLAVDEASKALAAGHEVSQRLLPPVDAGIFAQLWGRYVIRPIQARVKERAARRLKELLPGVEEDATVEEENPQPRGRCSVEVNLFYEGLTVSFPGAAEKAPVLQLGVSGAECQIQGFQSGDAVVAVSLVAVNLELDGRRLLTPRRGDKLLRVRIFRRGKHSAIQWTASWAQICILFRQRDYDRLVAHVTAAVQDAMPSRKKAEVANVSVTDTGGQSEESVARSGAKFRLDIGAPLVFLPTDGRCLSTSRLPATGAHEGGQLEIDQGEPTFRPLEGEGCLVLDFGHVAARGGGSSEDVQLQLRGAQVLGVTSNSRQEVLWPVSMQAVLQMPKDGPVEFHAVSMEADGGGAVDHHMSLSRANLTLILDVLAENVCYAGRSGHVGTSLLPQPTTQNQKRRSGFCFSWRWPGELIFDVSFTETVPLGRLRLRGGMLGFSSMPTGTMYQLHSSSMTAIDVRTRSRNRVKTLLECAEGDAADGLGFRVDVNVPMDADTVAVIQLQKPAMHVLPQLVMDLVTAGLSSWQHCTFRNDRAALLAQLSISGPGKAEPEKPDKRGTRVQVNFLDGTFRIAEKWAEPTEHFEFAGSFLIHIFVNMEGIRIERFDLEGGALRLRSAKRSTTTLCPCLEWLVRGDQRRVDDFARMKRHTTYDLRSVIVPPYAIRMSARDHRAMVNAFLEFLSMDAESAEPDCETRSRDPLVLQLVENRLTLVAEVAIEGAEVQVMGEEGGNEWPGLCANARCQLLQVTVDNRQGSTPTINIFGRELEIDISARNHRLGVWEPVLSRCSLRFSYHMQRKPDGGPRDVVVRGDVAAIKPVKVIISAPFVHLANRVFKESSEALQYGHLFSAVNISGLTCQVSVDDAESLILPSSAKAQPLDGLLKGRGRAAIGATPSLVLRLLDEEAEECRLLYGREADQPWDTKTAGVLMCRLVMPRPPQLILIITSTVCVWNRSPADLEVRFLSASEDMAPVLPTAQHCTDARIFDRGDGDAVPAGDAGGEAPDGEAVDGAEGVLQLKAGQLLSAPLAAQLRMGQSILQVRPATGVRYKWSEPFFSVPTNADTTICASPPDDMEEVLPKNWLHLTQRCGGSPADPQIGGWSHVEVQAPFTVINACPCDVLCQFNPRVTKRLMGKEKERLPVETSNIELVVDNGFGGEILIPNNGQAEVMPLRLDEEGYFRWLCNGREGRSRPRWRLNALLVVLNSKRGEVEWHCIQAVMPASTDSRLQLRIPPQNMLPAFEFLAEDLTISLAVRDQQGHASSWSLPLKAVISGPSTEVVQLEFKGMWITLNALRNQRELVIYNRWWFVNSTGLDVRLLQPGGPGPMHPVASFSNKVSLLPEIQNEAVDGVAFVGLRSHAPVEVRVPDVNGAVPVSVTALHPCCLRTEAVTLPEAMRGVPSCLVSLVPAMMVFNHTELEIGFRQYNCPSETALWVSSGLSRALWWHSTADQVIQMAARKDEHAKRTWSVPFELKESNIGAYPMVLKCGPSRQLFCVCLDYDAASLAVTVKDASFCHTLTNKHPELKLLASMEGVGEDPLYSFEADFGHTAAFGGRGLGSRPRLRLAVQHCLDPAQKATVMVDLHRSGIHRVPLCSTGNSVAKAKRKSTLRVSAAVSVVLRNRVALVSVTPGIDVARQGPQNGDEDNEDSTLRTLTGELRVDSLCIALVVEGPSLLSTSVWGAGANAATEVKQRREAFTVNLSQVQVQVSQTPDKSRNVDFQIWDVQVDMQHPRRDVILKSTSQPAVRTHTRRDDVRMLDAHLREVQLVLGNLEVSVSGALMDQGRMLRRNLTLGAGLTFADVLVRGKGALHLSNPPPASSKLVVNKLKVGDAKVDVWCQLHLPDAHYLPKSLRDTIQVVSLGTSRLDVKGAQVKLPQQVLFEQDAAEGNFSIVFERVCQHYLPLVKACWRSLLQHSNIFLGGLLSRHTWNPRQRRTWPSVSPVCRIGPHGELILNE